MNLKILKLILLKLALITTSGIAHSVAMRNATVRTILAVKPALSCAQFSSYTTDKVHADTLAQLNALAEINASIHYRNQLKNILGAQMAISTISLAGSASLYLHLSNQLPALTYIALGIGCIAGLEAWSTYRTYRNEVNGIAPLSRLLKIDAKIAKKQT